MIERFPLSWPTDKIRTPADQRKNALFKSDRKPISISMAANRVEAELGGYTKVGRDYRVPPESIIISTNVNTTKKGKPLSVGSEPDDPGAAVYFKLDGRDYCLPCDKWKRLADNLAAIAAHINAMRGIERWGVGTSKDVYTGFKALPQFAGRTKSIWWSILKCDENSPWPWIEKNYKELRKEYHPDNFATGDAYMFDLVQKAWYEAKAAKGVK